MEKKQLEYVILTQTEKQLGLLDQQNIKLSN